MTPLGRIPVTIQLGEAVNKDNLHIYLGVSGALISWKAAKGLSILHPHYPHPITEPCKRKQLNASIQTATAGSREDPTAEDLVRQFPTVFDGNIRVMEGEKFHISMGPDAVPFCGKTPRAIPFANRDKLKAELELLQNQGNNHTSNRSNGVVCTHCSHPPRKVRTTLEYVWTYLS